MKEFRMRAFFGIVGLAAAGFMLSSVTTVGCGSDSKGGSTGTAGTTGTAGATGTAGTTGGGGTTGGSGGGGGASSGALGCEVSDPPPSPAPIIADFDATDGGTPVIAIGGTYSYGTAPALPVGTVEGGAWKVTMNAPGTASAQYVGIGLYFNGNVEGTHCIDGTPYNGISFDVKGTVTGCTVQYSAVDAQHAENSASNKKASGAPGSGVYPPQLEILSNITTTGTTLMVPFSGTGAPTGGSPAIGVEKNKLIGVQWQYTIAAAAASPCVVDMTIDNVKFY
jgi:hypothetical protein